MWTVKNTSKQKMPSQIKPDISTLEAMGTRSRVLAEESDPTLFMALPRNTFPRGHKMMLIRIKGIVFSCSLRVCVTCSFRPLLENSKKSAERTLPRSENLPEKSCEIQIQRRAKPCNLIDFPRSVLIACASIQDVGIRHKSPVAFGNFS